MFDPLTLAIYGGLTLASQSFAARRARKKISDVEFPTDDPNRKIPYVAGTAEISPHVIDWGDFKRSPINLDIPLAFGLFLGGLGVLITWLLTRLPFGYRYYIGMALGLCYGPDVTVKALKVQDRIVWSGSISGGSFTINAPGEFGAEGGLYGVVDHVPGSLTQTRNAYWNTLRPNVPAFRGTSVLYWRGPSSLDDAPTSDASALLNEVRYCGYIGRSPVVKEFKVRVARCPNYLGTPWSIVKGVHANFAEVIYELLTDPIVGLGMPTSLIDDADFAAAAETLFNETLGCSFKWEQPTEVNDIIMRLLETVDGALWTDLDTGKLKFRLIRPDYVVDDLVAIDETKTGVELELATTDPHDYVGEVRIPFIDVENNFVEASALAQSISNQLSQKNVTSVELERFGLGDADAANKIATRDWRVLVSNLDRGTLRVNREAYNFSVGQPFLLSWAPYELEQKVFRVLEIDYGTLEDGKITIKIVEDQFSTGATQMGAVVSTNWTDPVVRNPTDGSLRRVISTTTTAPPASPAVGDRYWVPSGGTGAWSGQTGFASWDGTQWIFEPIEDSQLVGFFNEADEQIYFWDGTTLQLAILTAYNTVQDEGTGVTRRSTLNFIGANVSVADDALNGRTNVTITGGVTVRKNTGANVGTRPRINLIEGSNVTLTVADDGTDDEIDVTIAASTSGVADGDKGDVVVSSSGAVWTIDSDVVDNTKLANMAQGTIKGRAAGAGTGDPTDLSGTQVTAILDTFVGDSGSGGTKGLVPAPGAGDAAAGKFLKADAGFAQVKDSDLSTSDVTTNNVSTTKHGFAPKLPNDATKFLDGTGAYSTPSGGSPGGSSTELQYRVNSTTFGGASGTTWDNTNRTLAWAQGTLTASHPFLAHTATWNAIGTVFENFTSNITNTNSGVNSTLIDLQLSGVSQFKVRKSGTAQTVIEYPTAIRGPDGTAATPPYSFQNETNTGFRVIVGAGILASVVGSDRLMIGQNAVAVSQASRWGFGGATLGDNTVVGFGFVGNGQMQITRLSGAAGGVLYSATNATSGSGAFTPDLAQGQNFRRTLSGSQTFNAPSNMQDGIIVTFEIIQDATGSRVVTWNSAYKFPGGTAPTLSTGAGKKDTFIFKCDGTNMLLLSSQLDVR